MPPEPVLTDDRAPRFGLRAALGVVAAFGLLAVLYTVPLVTHLDDALPFAAVPPEGREVAWRVQGDYLQFYYYLWLVRDRLLAGASFLRDPYQFAVDGARLNLPNTFLPFALAFLPLSALGPRFAYNLLVLLSFPAAGLAAALLARRYGIGRSGALVAGVVFACLPYRVGALLGGHPAGLAYFLAPLALWGLEGALAGSLAGGAWCAVALVSLAIVEPHFFYFAALGLPLYGLARLGLPGWRRNLLRPGAGWWIGALVVAGAVAAGALGALARRGWQPPLPATAGVAILVALSALGVWQCAAAWMMAAGVVADGPAAARRSLLACLPWLAAAGAATRVGSKLVPVALALPVGIHAVWLLRAARDRRLPWGPLALVAGGAAAGAGFLVLLRQSLLRRSVAGAGRTLHEALLFSPWPADLVARANPAAGRAVYVGAVALALALVGTVALWRRPPAPPARVLTIFPLGLALGLALSLGPRLPGLPLFEAAFYLVPFWNFVRQPAKFQIVVGLALAILAAAGTDALGRRLAAAGRARLAAIAPVLLAGLVAAEYHPWRATGVSLLPTGGEPYDAIRAIGPRALYVPFWPGDSSYSALYLYATTLTRTPMLNGYSAWIDRAYVTEVYRSLETVNMGALGEAEYAALRRYGVRQVILDRDAFPMKVSPFGPAFTLAGLRRSPYLELVRSPRDGDALWVFVVRERPGPVVPGTPRSPLGVYWEAESLPRETGEITPDAEASNGRLVLARAGRDRPGFLVHGPYRMLPAGAYRAIFRLGGAGSRVELQVTATGGRRALAAREVSLAGGALGDVALEFELETPEPVEYRVKWDGAGQAAIDAVTIAFADVPDPAPAFEVEELGHELSERADPAASGGLAGYADPGRTPRDAVWSGPLRRYDAGRYRLWVRLKLDRLTAAPLAWCGVQAASHGPMAGGRELAGGEVGEAGRYVELAVPFALARPTVLEFPCIYRGTVGIWFDRLRVEGPLG